MPGLSRRHFLAAASQAAALAGIPNGDQIIGKGLEWITIVQDPAEIVFRDVQATLEQEAEPMKQQLAARRRG